MRRSLLAALLVSFVLLAACGEAAGQSACGASVSRVDRPLPDWKGPAVEGPDVDLADFRQGTAVINVWGSWCGPCRKEAPELVRATEENGDTEFLGVNVQDSQASAAAFEREFETPYPSAFDRDSELAGAITDATAPPVTLIAQDGRIRSQILGATTAEQISCAISEVHESQESSGEAR